MALCTNIHRNNLADGCTYIAVLPLKGMFSKMAVLLLMGIFSLIDVLILIGIFLQMAVCTNIPRSILIDGCMY